MNYVSVPKIYYVIGKNLRSKILSKRLSSAAREFSSMGDRVQARALRFPNGSLNWSIEGKP